MTKPCWIVKGSIEAECGVTASISKVKNVKQDFEFTLNKNTENAWNEVNFQHWQYTLVSYTFIFLISSHLTQQQMKHAYISIAPLVISSHFQATLSLISSILTWSQSIYLTSSSTLSTSGFISSAFLWPWEIQSQSRETWSSTRTSTYKH